MSKQRFSGSNSTSTGIPQTATSGNRIGMAMPNGVFLAKVVEIADADYGQAIHVEIVGGLSLIHI